MNRYIRTATSEDVKFVAQHMRNNDVEEVGALGFSPLHALERSHELSLVSFSLVSPQDNKPVAICGVGASTLHPDWGSVWLLGTDGIEKFPKTFIRNSREVLDLLYQATGRTLLYNYTYHKNRLHHDWLRWLGFKFIRKVTLNGEEFIEFARIRN